MAEGTEDSRSLDLGIGMRITLAGIRGKFPSVKNISTGTLANWIKRVREKETNTADAMPGDLVILDSRPEEEYVISHLADAIRVDYGQPIEETVKSVSQLQNIDKKTTVVCYCSVGFRSCIVARNLESYFAKQEIKNLDNLKVYNLEGSIFQWAIESRPMVDCDQKSTIFAHPYNVVFGKLLNAELRKKGNL